MTASVYLATTPDQLFQHLIIHKGDHLTLFTDECYRTKKISDLTLESIRSVFRSCLSSIGEVHFESGEKSYTLNMQGIKNEDVISSATFSIIVSGIVK